MRVALVHDWLITWRGGEKVLAAIAELYPQAPIYTLFHQPGAMSPEVERHPITSSLLDRIPGARARHRLLLPLLPAAIRTLDVGDVDLVISSSHCVAKAVRAPPTARHLSYVHAPLRYMWDRFDDYFGAGRASLPVRVAARTLRPALRAWDVATARGVDRFLANSHHVATQISQRYHRFARVLHPPVELERFTQAPLGTGRGGYFLVVGALAPYKRVDLAIEAFRRLAAPLWICGTGQESRAWLQDLPPNVRALGQVSDEELPSLYRDARALIFPGVEDFGLTPLEALASGRPVIALKAGGVLETVTSETGLFFERQRVEDLVAAVQAFDAFEATFSPAEARAHTARFSKAVFQAALREEADTLVAGK